MSSSHSPDDEEPLDSASMSGEAVTPRGGFMARPGLKPPPRHAVVVRGGDAPESEDIPLARSSFLPPPPPSAPAPPSASEKITLRAIPTPSSPPDSAQSVPSVAVVASVPPVVESLPPPSDAAVTASVRGPASWRRAQGSRWTIVAAAAAGLLLGFASVAARMHAAEVATQPQAVEELPRPPASVRVVSIPNPSVRANAPAEPSSMPVSEQPPADRKALPATTTGAKRSIF